MFQPSNKLIARLGIAKALNLFIFKILIPTKIKLPFKIKEDSLMALLSDRGMFSGFAAREFFMDVVIYAATRRTAFHRGFVKLLSETNLYDLEKFFGKDVRITTTDRKNPASKLLKYEALFLISDKERRKKSGIGEDMEIQNILNLLSNLTFKQFYQITNVNFGLTVSNFTTGLPLYFGHEWTPDFRVMEAVGASMSIPPAIRPLYNESDVVKTTNGDIPKFVSTVQESKRFVKDDGTFEVKDYHFFEYIVKKALAQEMWKSGIYIDVNNVLDLNSFLPILKDLVLGKISTVTGVFEAADREKTTTLLHPINGQIYIVDYALYKFFYNAAFKGLLIDGGYHNNIPYNFFREKGDPSKLDGVLAIKLDGTFPAPLMDKVYNSVKKFVDTERQMERKNLDMYVPKEEEQMNMLEKDWLKIRAEVEIIFINELAEDVFKLILEKDKKERKKLNKQVQRNNAVIERLVDESIEHYKKSMMSKPWKQAKSILSLAFEGYVYGSEMGQNKTIGDHKHIIPLYSYGIDTYDLMMDKIKPLVELSQAKAEEKIREYFK